MEEDSIRFAKVTKKRGEELLTYDKDAPDLPEVWGRIAKGLKVASGVLAVPPPNPYTKESSKKVDDMVVGFLYHYGSDILKTYVTLMKVEAELKSRGEQNE